MTTSGADTSHWNPLPAWGQFVSGGNTFLFAKCTEGTGFVDPNYGAARKGAHDNKVFFGAYHFARPGDPAIQARWFMAHAALGAGELPILDMEDPAIPDPVAWAQAWAATVKAVYACPPLAYLNQTFLLGHDWTPVVALNSGLWLARYDGDPNPTGPHAQWPAISFKQYTDKGTVAGIPGVLDVDSFNGDVATMHKYGIPATVPIPIPHPQPVPHPTVLGWNLPMGHYYGNITGPANCHGGVTPAERVFVRNIQQWLVFHGCAAGVRAADWAHTIWADGRWGTPTDTACALWHARFYPRQPAPTQCWGDDYRKLASL